MKFSHIILLAIAFSTFLSIVSCDVAFNLSPYFYVNSDSYDFGDTIVNDPKTIDIKIENHGATSLVIKDLKLESSIGIQSEGFSIKALYDNDGNTISLPYANIKLPEKSKLTAQIQFKPDTKGYYSANFNIKHNASNKVNEYTVKLKGIGQSMINPSPYNFGQIIANVKKNGDIRIDNYHSNTITLSNITISSGAATFKILSVKKNGIINVTAAYFACELAPEEFVIVTIEAASSSIAINSGSIAVYHNIKSISSPIYGDLLISTQENFPPQIQSVFLDKPVIKANGNEFVQLTIKATDPNGLEDISSVQADLTPLGDTFRQLNDNGQNGDLISNDGIFTLRFSADIKNKLVGRVKINISAIDFNNEYANATTELLFYTGYIFEIGLISYPYSSLEIPLNIAKDGDYILVHNGSFQYPKNTNKKLQGKELILRSENGAEYAELNCRNWGQGLIFDDPNGENAIVQGFKITNANGANGGGIFIGNGASPLILDCIIEYNEATNGGGIFCDNNSNPIIERCTINNNSATNAGGGIFIDIDSTAQIIDCKINKNSSISGAGIYCNYSNPTINSCEILDNNASNYGGGIAVVKSNSTTIVDSLVSNNVSGSAGGGVYINESDINIEKCFFENNRATSSGGGIQISASQGKIRSCKFVNNHATNTGGGVYVDASDLSFENCLFANNSANTSGGGLSMNGSCEIVIYNNTFAKNEAIAGGGVYYNCSSKTLDIYNTSIWGNNATYGIDIYNQAGDITLNNVNFRNNSGNIHGVVSPNSACVYSSPQFENTATNTLSGLLNFRHKSNIVTGSSTKFMSELKAGDIIYLDIDGVAKALTVANINSNSQLTLRGEYQGNGGNDTGVVIHIDYHLKSTSPCIDKGQKTFVPVSLTTDLDNNKRIVGNNVDIGVYEKQ